jgi:uncharacterized protein
MIQSVKHYASINSSVSERVKALPWPDLDRSLSERGYAVTPQLLSPAECIALRALYPRDGLFRDQVIMERFRFGRGDYKYFAHPLPEIVRELRTHAYPVLARIANLWADFVGDTNRFPATHEGFLQLCHNVGQTQPTPLLLHYEEDGYNCLHQDIYGAVAFPLQMVFMLGQQGRDWEGGEFVLSEQPPRAQAKVEVVAADQGCAVIFPTRLRPVSSARSVAANAKRSKAHCLVTMKHGVARVRSGTRYTLGIIFHDAE